MDDTDRKIAEHDDMIRDLVANDPLFKVFAVVEEDTQKGRRFLLVKRESGAGIQIPDPGEPLTTRTPPRDPAAVTCREAWGTC